MNTTELADLRMVIEAMPDGLAYLDAEGRYVVWNARYAQLAFRSGEGIKPGVTLESVLRAGVHAGLYPEAEGREEAWVAERLALHRTAESVHEQPLADGSWLCIKERRAADGGTLSMLVDITELKQREASFRLLFDSNPAPMGLYAADTQQFLAVNSAACILFRHSHESLLTRRWVDLLAPAERGSDELKRGDCALKAYAGERTWTFLRADGAEIRLRPFVQSLEHQGRAARLMALFDVTNQERAEAELTRTRQFLDTVVESMPTMLVVKDLKEHRYILMNRAGEQLMGWRRNEILGRSAHDLFPAPEADAILAGDRQVLTRPGVPIVHEGPIRTSQGFRQVRTMRVAMPGPEGPEHMLAIVEDVTEAKAAADALAQARDQAEAANVAKSEFLANMSHEIRTPLNGVLGLVGALSHTHLTHGQREMVEIIESSAATLERLLSDILDLAKVESGELQIENAPFLLGESVRSAASLSKLRADKKGLELQLTLDASAERSVRGDAVRLRQILTNLLSNAVKFTEAGRVTLSVRKEAATDDVYVFEVRDTGVGFSAEAKARLFSRFQQADGSITRRFGGTGLGLAISRSLAALMGGDLWADSEPGRGSTFTLRLALPDADLEPPAPAVGRETVLEALQRSAKVLLADDHPVNRRVVEIILSATGVELECVENGEEAIEAWRRLSFDLILMDMQMPLVGGLSAIQTIRAEEAQTGRRRTPILVLSANATAEHIEAGRLAGSDGHLSKPVQANILLAAVADHLNRSAATKTGPQGVSDERQGDR